MRPRTEKLVRRFQLAIPETSSSFLVIRQFCRTFLSFKTVKDEAAHSVTHNFGY